MPTQNKEFPSDFENLALYTGNVMKTSVGGRNSVFHKKSNMEILAAIDDTLNYNFSNQLNYRYYTENKVLEVPDLRTSSRIDPEDRDDVEVTAKLFYLLNHNSSSEELYAEESLRHLHKLLNVNIIDTLIVSDNKQPPSFSVWKSLENLVNSGKVQKLGVTDLSRDDLEAFLNDEEITVKPVIDHVHVEECCCNMPRELIQLGKEKGIELLHNGDCTNILTKEELTDLLARYGLIHDQSTTIFQPLWVLKYNVFIGSRNIVTDKGYIVVASRQQNY